MSAFSILRKVKTNALTSILAMGMGVCAHADDIDVYTANLPSQKKPNILFVLDYSGSMGDSVDSATSPTGKISKIDALKNAMRDALENNKDTINAGIGSLYESSTTGIRWPISELSADASTVDPAIPAGKFTVKDIILKEVNGKYADHSTATVDALVEAAQYFRGDTVTHNDTPQQWAPGHEPSRWDTGSDSYQGNNPSTSNAASYSPGDAYSSDRSATFYCNDYSGAGGPNYCEGKTLANCEVRSSTDATTRGFERLQNLWGDYQRCEYQRYSDWVGAKFNSPIAHACQSNTIVLISDGEPRVINDGASLKSIIGTDKSGCEDLSFSIFEQNPGEFDFGNCGPEVVASLSGSDQNPSIPGSNVRTFTVGFDLDGSGQNYLKLLAEKGDGTFFKVDKAEELTNAITTIIDTTLYGSENFSELSIDVDNASFSHDNRVFFSLFNPSSRRSWAGNLKGYFISPAGLLDINGQEATERENNVLKFKESAQSFWSAGIDGNDVIEGGASAKMTAGTRKLYTFTGDVIPPAGIPLAGNNANLLRAENNTISAAVMNLPNGSPLREPALDWIQNAPMGAPLHSKSVSVDYGSRRVVFVMTNQGFIHAIDATTPVDPTASDTSGGAEIFAFMPKRLLANLPAIQANTNTGSHIYGLDGKITRWHTDTNNDGIVNNGESVLLIMGMRRGGTAYYALDVSTPDAPKLKWILDDSNPDFTEMAQTWSRMSLITVNDNGVDRRVLAFAAGYDASIQDSADTPTASRGNAIYMIDDNADLLWKTSVADNASMQYSIPSDLTVIDSDDDKLADRLYVGDVAGQVWRVDFEDIDKSPVVTLMAALDDGDHQPFFYAPSVALNKSSNGDFLSVSLGSGNRTNPLEIGSNNKLYMLRDTNLDKGAPKTTLPTILPGKLFDVTSNSINSSDKAIANAAKKDLKEARGWKLLLGANEKSLSKVVTFEGKLLATTFDTAPPSNALVCTVNTSGRYYLMDVSNASPVDRKNSTLQTQVTAGAISRWTKLSGTGIPSSPVVVFPKGSGVVQVIVDKETVNLIDQELTRVYWHTK